MTDTPASSDASSFAPFPLPALESRETDLAFADIEPGENQRWSTWPASTPSERGPEPRPDWVVTSAGAIDTELGILKTGKEADVFLIERAVPEPAEAARRTLLAAKRYRSSEHRTFHRSAVYTEGRRTRNTRDTRALAKKTGFGREVAAGQWAFAEFDALRRLWLLGVPVPYPVQVTGTEILMEFVGSTDGAAAPRLAQVRAPRTEMAGLFEQTAEIMRLIAGAGFAHGDLSPYNLLVHDGRVRVIDLPQIVDVIANPQGLELLHRDCVNVCDWFQRRRVECDAEELFADLLTSAYA